MTTEPGQQPPAEVLAAFGAPAVTPEPLPGGEGTSWRAGSIALKPAVDERFATWHAEVMDRVPEVGFRVARPVAAHDGGWVHAGWSASLWIPGSHEHRWLDVVSAGEAFHRALAEIDAPEFLAERGDPWAVGDRVAWGEEPVPLLGEAHDSLVRRLIDLRRPVELPPQLIHGDLTENVLFEDGLAPAVIDLAPYRRPVGFASAIVVGDALLWFNGDAHLAASVAASVPVFGQFLVRALIYRLVTERVSGATNASPGAEKAIGITAALA